MRLARVLLLTGVALGLAVPRPALGDIGSLAEVVEAAEVTG